MATLLHPPKQRNPKSKPLPLRPTVTSAGAFHAATAPKAAPFVVGREWLPRPSKPYTLAEAKDVVMAFAMVGCC